MPNRMASAMLVVMVVLMLGVIWAGLAGRATAAAGDAAPPAQSPDPRQEREGDPAAPAISFIDSPAPTCYRPVLSADTCFINWAYVSVSATAPQYIISMTVAIDGHVVAAHSGFFQTSMYVPPDIYGEGFQVSCGVPGAAGIPGLGRAYNYTLRARETGGLGAANYGTVACPAGLLRFFLPVSFRSAP